MRRSRVLGLVAPLLASGLLAACSGGDAGDGDIIGPPDDPGPPTAPNQPPPTGSKWAGVQVTGECGRTKLVFVLVDEVCGGTDDPNYMDYFHAPIMRDGALIGDDLFAVDATYLWVLDTTNPDDIQRKALLAGFGQPLAVATHANTLLIAAGDEGLLVVDPSDPTDPVRLATIDLEGPALDVFVDGDQAFVAIGAGGVAVVDLVTRTVEKTLDVPGFAAAVAARNGRAYVAACDTFAIIDVAANSVVGETWVQNHTKEGILVAPAKDVALEGDVAFVAAGRFGAVSVDVSSPSAPEVLGNCTEQTDLSFYASGVRQEGGKLFVAGGEWGVKSLDLSSPEATCASTVNPALPPIPEDNEAACSTEPPWEVLPWAETWAPPPVPPEGRDPLQTLPVPGRVYAFGDATRIGLRAIDIKDPADLDVKLGRYSEPRLTEGIATLGDRVLVAGKGGGLFRAVGSSLVLETDLAEAKTARAAAFLGDGRWVLGAPNPQTGGGTLLVEGGAEPIEVPEVIWAGGIATKADTVFVAVREGALAVSPEGADFLIESGREAELPQAIAVEGDHLFLAAPEWSDALVVKPAQATPLAAPDVFDAGDLADVALWQRALPRRQLVVTNFGAVEIASLGHKAGAILHDGGATVPLPPGDYVAAATDGDRVFAVAADRGRYRTMLVTISLDGGVAVTNVTAFTGMGTAVATIGNLVYLADGDRGVRIFDTSSGAPQPAGIVELGGAL